MKKSNESPVRRTWDGVLRIFLAEALFVPTGLVTAAYLGQRLGPEGYGLLTLAWTIVAWVEWSVASVFARATIKLVSEADDWKSVGTTVLRWHLVLGCGATLLVWLGATTTARLLDEPDLVGPLRLLAIDVPVFSLVQAHRNILTGLGDFRGRAVSSAGRWLARLALILLLVGLGLSVTGAILASIGTSLLELAICRRYVQPSLFDRVRMPVRLLWTSATPLFLMGICFHIYERIDLVAFKGLGGTIEEVGCYGAAQNLALLPALLALSLSPVLLSSLVRELRSGNLDSARSLARGSIRATVLSLPVAGVIAGCAPEFIGLVFGPRFASAAPVLTFLIFAAMAMLVISVASTILTAAERPYIALALIAPLIPLAIVGQFAVIPVLGSPGAALVTLVGATMSASAQLLAVHKIWEVHPRLGTLGRAVLASGVVVGLGTVWPVSGFMRLLKPPTIGLAGALVLIVLGEFSPSEIATARSIFIRPIIRTRDEMLLP